VRVGVASAVVALALACGALLSYDLLTFRETLAQRLVSAADIIGHNSASALVFNVPSDGEKTLSALKTQPNIIAAALYTPQKQVFAVWKRASAPDFPFPASPAVDESITRSGAGFVETFRPILLDGARIGTVFLRSDLSERLTRVRRYALIVVTVLLLSTLIASVVALRLGRQIAKPILALSAVARRVSEERDYAVRVKALGEGEIGVLERTFNDMLSQIQSRGRALQAAHDELEQKVIARTVELRQKEEELFQSRKMESIGRLAGGIAHDFNNLLTGIIGCAETLEGALRDNPEVQIEALEIKKAGNRAAMLTRQLLAFGRKQVISPQPLNLNEAIGRTAKMLERLLGEDIEIRTVFDPDLRLVRADPSQIDQILINISVNARDAMSTGGRLTIKTSNVRLQNDAVPVEVEPGDYVMMAFTDTGHGMSKEVRGQIFEPFFTTKEMGKGTGLGLSTVYGIVKQNNGAITVYSHPGMGTTFKIFFPAIEPSPQQKRPESFQPALLQAPNGSETILLVEDEELVASHLARLLRGRGYTVVAADSGAQALELMRRREAPVDLVLTDVIMPGMNGRELVQKLRESAPRLPALFMSGYPSEIVAKHGVVDPGISFVEKPFQGTQVLLKIRELLSQR
jgi:signal transduction histidine kinase